MQRRVFLLVVCFVWSGCNERDVDQGKLPAESRTAGAVAGATTPASTAAPLPYASGPWWQADMTNLYVSAAHILVTHHGAEPWSAIPGEVRSERSRDRRGDGCRELTTGHRHGGLDGESPPSVGNP